MRLARQFAQLGWKRDAAKLWDRTFLSCAVSAIIAGGLFYPDAWLMAGVVVACLSPLIVLLTVPDYLAQRRTRRIEDALPEALYRAASLSSFSTMESVIEELAREKTELGKEFASALRRIRTGMGFDDALRITRERNDSRLLSRSVELIIVGYDSGADISRALRSIADDASDMKSALREKAAAAFMEKATLLMGGGVIVPIILGAMVSLVNGLNGSSLAALGIGMDAASRAALLSSSILGNKIYILVYACMASTFVAQQEGMRERALLYAAILAPLSFALFTIASGMRLA